MSDVSFLRFAGHRYRELLAHFQRLSQPSARPRAVFFPSQMPAEGGSALLRAFNVAANLRPLGWRTTVVPPQCELVQRRRILRLEKPDLIVLQMQRHPLNRPSLYDGFPAVFDIDDADFLDPRCVQAVRECCQASRAVTAGSRFVADWCSQFNPNVTVLWTAAPVPKARPIPRPQDRAPVLTWAQSVPDRYPAERELVGQIICNLARRGVKFEFWLYGVTDPTGIAELLSAAEQFAVPVKTHPFLPYPEFIDSLSHVAVGLQPIAVESPFSRGKSFGKILAYLAADVAVVASDALDHPLFFRQGENGLLARSLEDWITHTARLLQEPDFRRRLTDQAWQDFSQNLSIESAAQKMKTVFQTVLRQK
ncbi:MAG: glycosyltransferase [Tepidisphaeraceae bacterium]